MEIDLYFISGVMLGFEFVRYEEDGFTKGIVLDLFIIRLLVLW